LRQNLLFAPKTVFDYTTSGVILCTDRKYGSS
jgi:hypothetical protein